jgi:hypothetical protein
MLRVRRPHSRGFLRRNYAGARLVLVVAAFAGLVALGAARWQQHEPRHSVSGSRSTAEAPRLTVSRPSSPGQPVRAPTALRLLVADAPAPFVVDVDRQTVQPITGLPAAGERGVTVAPVGKHALVLSQRFCASCPPESELFLLRHHSTVATALGRALQAVPSRDGQSAWIITRRAPGRCMIAKLGLDGRRRHGARPVSCRTGLVAELPAGMLVERTGRRGRGAHSALLRPGGRVIRLPYEQALPVVGNLVLTGADRHRPLHLRDAHTGARFRLRWPSRPDYGLGEATGEPTGRLAIVEFTKYSPQHRLDMWLLDTATRRWRHLPGMPARLIPKATDARWTADGRIVILSGHLLAVWRAGQPRLATQRLPPPTQPGSQFLIW